MNTHFINMKSLFFIQLSYHYSIIIIMIQKHGYVFVWKNSTCKKDVCPLILKKNMGEK